MRDFAITKNLSIEVSRSLGIGSNAHHVAAAQYVSTASAYWDLARYSSKDALLQAFANLRESSGGSNLAAGLDFLRLTTFADNARGNRPRVPNIACVYITSPPTDDRAVTSAAAALRSVGTIIIAVDLSGRTRVDVLNRIATNPGYVVRGRDTYKLSAQLDLVFADVCTPVTIGKCSSTCHRSRIGGMRRLCKYCYESINKYTDPKDSFIIEIPTSI